ncbi:uncharacterized protein LOC128680416 [Plodia interpunctella]|uniref:uncharacterized protein LOC128680416 n=1 Tax=Plodia interpunctella TaxID=58824 RepID=UPI0023682C59|nr:uncharacterized protein LOC128680416 [Plodia interpunctella]
MSKLSVTKFSKKAGSPFHKPKDSQEDIVVVHEEIQKTHKETQKEMQNELLQKVNKKTAEYQAHKPSSGVFTEVVTHGAFTSKNNKEQPKLETSSTPAKAVNGNNGSKLLGFPSSANDLALDAKTDLESDPNISKEVKEMVIEKLFALASMVQHMYESKVRVMTEYEKFKDTHLKNEIRREKEHSEQLYKINMNFQNEVIQSMQRLRSELDISRNVTKDIEENSTSSGRKDSSIEFSAAEDNQHSQMKINNNVEENEYKTDYENTDNVTNLNVA